MDALGPLIMAKVLTRTKELECAIRTHMEAKIARNRHTDFDDEKLWNLIREDQKEKK